MRRPIAFAPLLTVVCLSAQQPATPARPDRGQPPMTFKVEVNYIEIDATVTDAQGRPVTDLGREDFQLMEDGKLQAVTVFSHVALPVERPDPLLSRTAIVAPDVRTNKREFDGRVFVLMLDDLHTSFSRTGRLRAAATAFIQRHMGANDVAAVVYSSAATDRAQEFTGNRSLLLAAVARFMGQKLPSGAVGVAEQDALLQQSGQGGSARDPNEMERAYKDRQLFARLRGVAEYLGGVHGRRKSIVLFSEGIDTDISQGKSNTSARSDSTQRTFAADILNELQTTVGAAGRANVSIYASAYVDELLKDVLPDMPTVTREFPRGDELTVYAEIYDQLTTPHKVDIATTATADDGRVMYSRSDQQSSAALRSPGDGFGHLAAISLKDVVPGRYVLRIEARSSIAGTASAVRELEFTIR